MISTPCFQSVIASPFWSTIRFGLAAWRSCCKTIIRVVDIRVDPDNLEQIEVTVEVDTSIVDIKSDARAFLEANILNGIATIQIRGGTRQASELVPRPGRRYAVITAGRSELEEVK